MILYLGVVKDRRRQSLMDDIMIVPGYLVRTGDLARGISIAQLSTLVKSWMYLPGDRSD